MNYEIDTELELSDIPCPKCDSLMRIYPEGQTDDPDTDTFWLVCPNCKYTEKE